MGRRFAIFAVASFLSQAIGAACFGQEPAPETAPQPNAAAVEAIVREGAADDAIRAASKAFIEAFNRHDAKAIAALWTPDGGYRDETGKLVEGRPAIEKEYAAFFAQNPDSTIRLAIDSIRLLNDTTAIEEGRAFIDSPSGSSPIFGQYDVVHAKTDGVWLMSMVRETAVQTTSAYGNVADLEWLIGEWSAEERGAAMNSVCRWVANKSFVERRYAVTQTDGVVTAGVQIIGWNPAEGRMQSWNFSSDGGLAIGVWSPVENGWVASVDGVTGQGVPSHAVNRLVKLDDDAYVWQSTERVVGGQPLPDSEEIVLKRRAPSQE